MKFNYFTGNINHLRTDEIFVFGSNLAGIHGSGAARLAKDSFGAELYIGEGYTGQCYAIPTKDEHIISLGLRDIKVYVDRFCEETYNNLDKVFICTQVGCGLAGYIPKEIAWMFKKANPYNTVFDYVWQKYLED